jgi:peptidoglycan/xylan/chitin deacetylase (PgdA/CDA1 family)
MTSRAFRISIFAALLTATPIFASRQVVDIDAPSATILCYHIVESPQDPRMEISREVFRQQMRYLDVTGYTVVPLRDIYEYAVGKRASLPKNPVVITVDDGWRSTYTEVFPEMKRRHLPFTVFIYPKIIGQTAYALTWRQVKEMAHAGVDIQSHSFSHPFLTHRRHGTLDNKQYSEWLQHELRDSKRLIERETGRLVTFLAYPYGDYDHFLAANVAKAGYEAALTCDFGRVTPGCDPLRLKRVVIDKRMDFAAFRHYLGARPLPLEEMMPEPGQVLDAAQSVTISARIPNYKTLDPRSVGIALLSMAGSLPYSYDPRNGLISLVINDSLKGKLQRALVWATEVKSGRRVEASWTFRLPEFFDPAFCPPIDPQAAPFATPAMAPAEAGGGRGGGIEVRLQLHRAPKQ